MSFKLTKENVILAIAALITLIMLSIGTANYFSRTDIDATPTQTVRVTIPEKHGTFDTITPTPKDNSAKYIDSISYKDKYFKLLKRVDMLKVQTFAKALQDESNPIKPLELYTKAVEKNSYSQDFFNDKIKVTVNAQTTGTLDKLNIDWKIPEQVLDVKVPIKEPVISMYLGGQVYSDIQSFKPGIKADLGIQGKGPVIYTVGYGKQGPIDQVFIGANIRVFQVKR